MTLWRLELLRLGRTHRWMILFGVYVFFAVLGPLTAAYFDEIVERFGGDVVISMPDPQPVDGVIQFLGNATQLGLLAVVIVATGALAVDARPEVASFLRTRVDRPHTLLVPRYVVSTAAAALALVAGTAVAWIMTAVLIGPLAAGPMIVGTVFGILYLAFAVAVVAVATGYARTQITAVFAALAVLIALPALGLAPAVKPWLPSELLAAVADMVAGEPAGAFARSVAVSLVATAGLLALATRRFGRREL